MRLGKFFILTLLATCPIYSASAMEKDETLTKITSLHVKDRPDITYNGRVGHGAKYRSDKIYQEISSVLGTPKDYFIYSNEDGSAYEESGEPRLCNLLLTKWTRKHQAENDDRLIVLWEIHDKTPYPTKDSNNYDRMKDESCMIALETVVDHLTKDHKLYMATEFADTRLTMKLKKNETLNGKIKVLSWKDKSKSSGSSFSVKLLNGGDIADATVESLFEL